MKPRSKSSAPQAPAFQAWGEALGQTLQSLGGLQANAAQWGQLQSQYLQEAAKLWNTSLAHPEEPAPKIQDRRFAASAWSENPSSAYLAQMYLLNARTLMQMAESLQGDEKAKARVRFAVQQWIDAASPSNFLATNPEALQLAVQTQGESLTKGMQQLWQDLQKGHVSQTDESVFEVGRNVATTEGAVVFENEYFQLLEYKPLTAKVHQRPMLFIPPCINKFYIMDLQPGNSLIRYTVAQGHRLFVISWRNPDDSMKSKTWDDYIEQAAIRAIDEVRAITNQDKINTLGFCVGGTILATALAVLADRGVHPAHSVTLLTTLLDFRDTGILDVFVDEAAVQMREMSIGQQAPGGPGLLRGKELATTFSFLRPNDLVWNYVVGNYLKGEAPPAFDLLYWNGDSTNLPGPMYCWYLRHMYLQDELRQPGRLVVCGQRVDLSAIRAPVYLYGSREDHIVPWMAAYRSTRLFKGPTRFVMGASGHIAGVINPPAAHKRSYWTHDALPDAHEQWLELAHEHPGSWWTDWTQWLKPHGGKQVAAPKTYGDAQHQAIEPAPGRYVKVKA